MTARNANSGVRPAADAAGQLALLEAVQRRDRAAFTELYRLYHPRLFGYLRRLLPNAAIVEEVLDDVMFVVWKDAGRFRGRSAVSSWIFGIAYNKAMSALRKERRHDASIDRGTDTDSLAADPSRDFEVLQAGLAQLSADHRQVVVLTYFCGFSYEDIAEIADCPVNTVKTRMFHARRRLKYLLPVLAGTAKEANHEHG